MTLLAQRAGPRAAVRRERLIAILLAFCTLTVGRAAGQPAFPAPSNPNIPASEAIPPGPWLGASSPIVTAPPVSVDDAETPGASAADVTPPPRPNPSVDGGFGGPGGIGGPGGVPGYSVTWYPSRPVSGQGTDLGDVKQNLSVGVPVWRAGGDAVLVRVGVSDDHFFTGAILPDTRQAFPTDLWNISLGANFLHKFDNGWTGMLLTNVGSASDQPFHGIREMTYGVGAIFTAPAFNERDKWTFGLMYSPSGALNFPVPILSYAWNPSDNFHLNIGLPLSMMWKPTEDLTIDLSYTPVTNVNALATYRLSDSLRVYGGYRNLTESYFLVDRVNTSDRFFGLEQRLLIGVKWDLLRNINLDVNGGYAFDRRFGEGKNQTSGLYDEVDVSSGAFLGLKLNWKF